VYTDRPEYADFDPPEKFQAIMGIIMTRLRQHPKAICSYSGGSDSDIMIHLIEEARKLAPSLPKVDYVFFNTGLEMKATKDHVKETAERYGVEIVEYRPTVNISGGSARRLRSIRDETLRKLRIFGREWVRVSGKLL
jgi:3'-phosphoadenosine 5'-phosphosulfate sulfotransferase (PAPS reductase)/FAD synthetase